MMADPLKRICNELGVCREEALFYLEGFRWDLNAAMEACRSKTLPSPSPTVQSSPGNDKHPLEEQWRNQKIGEFLHVAVGTTVDEATHYLSINNWNLKRAVNSYMGERRPTLSEDKSNPHPLSNDGHVQRFSGNEGSKRVTSDLMEDVMSRVPQFQNSSTDPRIKISAPPRIMRLTSPSQLTEEERIKTFCVVVGATREVAKVYLEYCKWDVNQAADLFFDPEFSVEYVMALNMSLKENRDLPLSSMGLPSQSQFEDSYISQNQGSLKEGSSSSLINAGPTETQRPLEEAGEENVTVAIPGMASSQVDGNAVEEVSSRTDIFPDLLANQDRTIVETQTASDTITITIVLADDGSGASLDLPFRSNQTVRDIHNAIQEQRPENDRDYYLQSTSGVEYGWFYNSPPDVSRSLDLFFTVSLDG